MNNVLNTQYCPLDSLDKVTISWCTESRCGNMIKNSCPRQRYLRVFQVRAALFHQIAWARAVRKPDRGAALNEKLILSEHVFRAPLACLWHLDPRFCPVQAKATSPPCSQENTYFLLLWTIRENRFQCFLFEIWIYLSTTLSTLLNS